MNINKLKTPCFVIETDRLLHNIRSFKTALDSRFKHNVLSYSVKTNSTPALLSVIKDEEGFAEVVSYHEYNLAILLGFAPNQIVYNGPLKDQETFLHALENGAIVNIDTKRELLWLSLLPSNKVYNVGLRVNLNLMEISPEDCKDKEDYSRFGFSTENDEFEEAVNMISKLGNVKLAGLHLHRTSKTRSLDVYQNICRYAIKVVKQYNLDLDYIDVGGGFYGDMPGKPIYNDYVDVIAESLSSFFDISKLTLIVEPGNAIIASPFTFYSSVIDTKQIGNKRIVVLDGSRNDIDPFFHKSDYFKSFLTYCENRAIVKNQVYVGCTCLENDKLFEINNHFESQVGDIIKFSFVGAYTICLSPLFIRYFPRIYVQKGDEVYLSREEWNADNFLQGLI
jgi:diaminopimelate decarboxylase